MTSPSLSSEMSRLTLSSLPSPYISPSAQTRFSSYVARTEETAHRPSSSLHNHRVSNSPSKHRTTPRPYKNTYLTRENTQDLTTTSTIRVGSKPTIFLIHTSLLTQQSAYFRAALTGSFAESKNNTINLDDVSVEHFQLLTSFLYTSVIPLPFKDGKPAYYTLLHTYALADRLGLEAARNAIIDAVSELADSTNSVLTPSDTWLLYDEVRASAPLRDLVLDLFAYKKTDRLIEGHEDAWHEFFLRDLNVRLKRPCRQVLERHRLKLWCPEEWSKARACEVCKRVLPPRRGAIACEECGMAFCNTCVKAGVAVAGWEDSKGSAAEEKTQKGKKWEACKPWRGARCALYHEHAETEKCSEAFFVQ